MQSLQTLFNITIPTIGNSPLNTSLFHLSKYSMLKLTSKNHSNNRLSHTLMNGLHSKKYPANTKQHLHETKINEESTYQGNVLLEPNTNMENLRQLVECLWLTMVSSHYKELTCQFHVSFHSNPLEIHDTQVIVATNLLIISSLFKILFCLQFAQDTIN